MNELPVEHLGSLTSDRGMEMARHGNVKAWTELGYIPDRRNPWQRGTNDDTYELLRQDFLKGLSLAGITQVELDAVVAKLSSRPREALGFATPTATLERLVQCLIEVSEARFGIAVSIPLTRNSRRSGTSSACSTADNPCLAPLSMSAS